MEVDTGENRCFLGAGVKGTAPKDKREEGEETESRGREGGTKGGLGRGSRVRTGVFLPCEVRKRVKDLLEEEKKEREACGGLREHTGS